AAAAEVRRCAADQRFVQVQFTGRPQEPMGRRKYWPIYEACAEHGLHVMSHAFGSAGQPITLSVAASNGPAVAVTIGPASGPA
ncbi:MAG TPA: amidohydrolase family protein, partial [Chloroflexota bacterium]|nr:amidohydrolase family protein [Chloroflexota bacterium]